MTARPDRHPGRAAFWGIAALLAAGIELVAVASGTDATWDLRNYHLYNPFALLHKPFGTDIAPGHMQTFLSPTLDLFYYAAARTISSAPLLNAVLALPQAAATVVALALAWRLLRPENAGEAVALGLLAAMAATGAAALPTVATSMSEMAPVTLVLGAWLVLVRPDLDQLPTKRQLFAAGLLAGAACGLKLTLSFAALSLFLVVALLPPRRWADIVVRAVLLGMGLLCGVAALSGYWWVIQWIRYDNPLFPILNHVFRSPHAPIDAFVDRTFLPRSWGEAFSAPWSWALKLSWSVGESRLRDPRFALAIAAALLCIARAMLPVGRRPPWPVPAVACWFVLSFALWRAEFSIARYLSVLEPLTGTMVALAAFPIARSLRRPVLLPVGTAALVFTCQLVTVYPRLNRSSGGPPFAVELGPLPSDATVLLLDNEPMGYLAVFADPRVRFVATNDYFMTLDATNPMQLEVEAAIGTAGRLFGLEAEEGQGDRSDATLARYGLEREACRRVASNLSPQPIRLCALRHRPPPGLAGQ